MNDLIQKNDGIGQKASEVKRVEGQSVGGVLCRTDGEDVTTGGASDGRGDSEETKGSTVQWRGES